MGWREWSETLWEKWGVNLQNKYDKYRNLKTPEWYLKITDSIWENLDDTAKAWLNKFLEETIKTFDDAFAKELIDKIVKAIKKKLGM